MGISSDWHKTSENYGTLELWNNWYFFSKLAGIYATCQEIPNYLKSVKYKDKKWWFELKTIQDLNDTLADKSLENWGNRHAKRYIKYLEDFCEKMDLETPLCYGLARNNLDLHDGNLAQFGNKKVLFDAYSWGNYAYGLRGKLYVKNQKSYVKKFEKLI